MKDDFKKKLKPIISNFTNSDKKLKSNPFSSPKMHPSYSNGNTYLW